MQYRRLGRTDLRVSVLGFGGSSLGSVFGPIDEPDAIRAVHLALDRGINLIDVSPYYGLLEAERVLGRALRGVARGSYLLATKVGRYGADEFDFSEARVTASVEESLSRLGVDHVDLIQCHDIEFVPLSQIWQETLPALEKLRAAGKVRFVGVTGLPLSALRRVASEAPLDTVLSYCRYTLADTTLSGEFSFYRARDIGVINASPLGMGLLTGQALPAWHPAPEVLRVACARAAAHCRARGADLARLALQFAVRQPEIATTVVGMASTELVERNLEALETPLDEVLLGEVRGILEPVRDLSWPSGLAENADPDSV